MVNTVDLQDPLCETNLINSEALHFDYDPTFLSALASAHGCGLFLLVDKMIKKQPFSHTSALLGLDLLRGINCQSISVSPSLSDDAIVFVARLLRTATDIADGARNEHSSLFASAKRLTEDLHSYEQKESEWECIENSWRNFSLHYYREQLYQRLPR